MKCKGTRKIVHIINEVYLFLLEKNATRIINELIEWEEKTTIFVSAKVDLSDQEFKNIKDLLEAHHEYEYDEYWALVGEGAHPDEMTLLSSLIDFGEVKYEGGVLTVFIERNR